MNIENVCPLCGKPQDSGLCDRCFKLRQQVINNPDLAVKILRMKEIEEAQNERPN